MTRKNIIDDLTTILTKAGETDESRLDPDYLGYKIDQRRAKEIRDTYRRNPVIDPTWMQDFGIFDLSKVNKAEDTAISVCDCEFGKFTLPTVVSVQNPTSNTPDLGVVRIVSACGNYEYYPITAQKLGLVFKCDTRGKFRHYIRVGNAIYLTPEVNKARAILILDNPLDGFVLQTEIVKSGDLVVGTSYTVKSGSIVHNLVTYYKGDVFAAAATTFTGNGLVEFTNQKRAMTNDDVYPMSHTMMEVVIMKILTQEFKVEQSVVSDLVNDSQDELQVVSSGQN